MTGKSTGFVADEKTFLMAQLEVSQLKQYQSGGLVIKAPNRWLAWLFFTRFMMNIVHKKTAQTEGEAFLTISRSWSNGDTK